MKENFLSDNSSDKSEIRVSREAYIEPTSSRESVKILVIGSPKGVNNIIHTLYRLNFAQISEWSSLQPTPNPGEVVSILIRQLSLS